MNTTEAITITETGRALLEEAEQLRLFNVIDYLHDVTVSSVTLTAILDANADNVQLCDDLRNCKLHEAVSVRCGIVQIVRVK